MSESVHLKIKLSPEIKESFGNKNWDSFKYIFWGITSIILGLIIFEYFLFESLWQITFVFKLLVVGVGLFTYTFLRPRLLTPDGLILLVLYLFSAYCFTIIQFAEGMIITVYFSILTIVIGFSNYLVLWKAKFSFFEVGLIVITYFLFQWNLHFESFEKEMLLGGYSFFAVLLISAFIPDARKRNYLLNLERDILKDEVLGRQNKKLNTALVELSELKEIAKINSQKEKIIRHDLKNKFTNIIGLSQLIEINEGQISQEDESYLNLLKEVSTDLLTYSDTIFSTSEKEDGSGLKLSLQKISLVTSLNKIKQEITPKLDARGITLIIKDSEVNSVILADFLVFNTIIENILNYLIIWSQADQEVLISSLELAETVRIELCAPSAQVQPDNLNSIFKPLENFEFQSSFDRPTGLGLQIAKSMTARMKGYFKYQTSQTEGVTFKLEFPKAPATKP